MFSVLSAAWLLAASPAAVPAEPPAPAEAPAPTPPAVWLGVFLDDAADGGVQVLGLVPGGPADRGGVQSGDVLLGVAGVSILDVQTLSQTLRTMKPGQRAEFRLLRDGSLQTVPLVLGDASKAKAAVEVPTPVPRPRTFYFPSTLGLEVVEITPELRAHYGAPTGAGALVVQLDPDGPASRAGLRVGDVLVRAGERQVEGQSDVLAGLLAAPDDEVPLQVVRAHKMVTVSVPRPAVPRPRRAAPMASESRVEALRAEVDRLKARVAELEAELEKARHE